MAARVALDISVWPSLTFEGNLIPSAMLSRIDKCEALGQDRSEYGVRKGLEIRDEISLAFRVGQSHFGDFARSQSASPGASRRFAKDFLTEVFSFHDMENGEGLIAWFAGEKRIPVVVVPPSEEKLDRPNPTLSGERSRSPIIALQDYLSNQDEALWGVVTNGKVIRLVRDNGSLTRPAYIEADLAQIFTTEDAASFGLLWLLIHRSRFGGENVPATDCALERWRNVGIKEGEVARGRLAGQVKETLKILGSGFLVANPDLAAKVRSGQINLTDWFNDLLRLVYRLIFLMVAEDRNLLHPKKSSADAQRLYKNGYSLAHLRTQCSRAATRNRNHDRFEGMKIVFQALASGEPKLALPALGGLFAPNLLPHLENAHLSNGAFMEGLQYLSWFRGGGTELDKDQLEVNGNRGARIGLRVSS